MINVVVTGCAGRMGREIAQCVIGNDRMALFGGTESEGHPSIGASLLGILGEGANGASIHATIEEVLDSADVVIDFTVPSATVAHFHAVADRGKAIVIGTTGFTPEQLREMDARRDEVRCVRAPNMSVGVNVMFKLVAEAVKALGAGYDMEVVEIHHNRKQDAPSGTADRLARILAETAGRDLDNVGVYGRQGIVGARKPDEIGVMSLRLGDVVGDHTVFFGGEGERLEIIHRCTSRKNFAAGAVRAAEWAVAQEPGIYDMQDVLGLR